MKNIVSISFGKDSLAMLLRMLDENMKIDEVVFFDTGMEFNCIYSIMKQVKSILDKKHIKFTRLKADNDFLYYMLEHPINHRDGSTSCGYKWCGGNCRWFTTFKVRTIKKYLSKYVPYVEYVGIAYDELNRVDKNQDKKLPLIDWQMTEDDCLKYCHSKGFYWYEGEHELYDHLDRVSCWCCRNKNLKELKEIYTYFKPYWLALCELENRCQMRMKNKSLYQLEKKFEEEKKQMKFEL